MKAYVTLLVNESYVPGALVLGSSLRKTGTKYKLAIMMDTSTVSPNSQDLLRRVYDDIIEIDDEKIFMPIDLVTKKLGRPQLAVSLTKILIWQLYQYDHVMYLDADTVPIKSLDHLFDKYASQKPTEVISAPDIGWPDVFNSGVMLVKPDPSVFKFIRAYSETENASYDGADQGLLNEVFHLQGLEGYKWTRLPFIYNVTPSSLYQSSPATERFLHEIHLVHFVGASKPWLSSPQLSSMFYDLWWKAFNDAHLEKERIHLLSRRPNDGYSLKSKEGSTFLDETSISSAFSALNVREAAKVFPWEHREPVAASRVFEK